MLLKEITYSILELIREGAIVDDERIDIRLLENLVRSRRAEYIKNIADTNKVLPDDYFQYFDIDIYGKTIQEKLYNSVSICTFSKIVHSRFGPLVSEVTFLDNPLHSPFKIVNNHHFKYTGNGRFNRGLTYVTYRDSKFFLKSNDNFISYLDKIGIKAVLENPEDAKVSMLKQMITL